MTDYTYASYIVAVPFGQNLAIQDAGGSIRNLVGIQITTLNELQYQAVLRALGPQNVTPLGPNTIILTDNPLLASPITVSTNLTISAPGFYIVTAPRITITLLNGPLNMPGVVIIKDWTSTTNPQITISGAVATSASLINNEGGSFTYSWSPAQNSWIDIANA